MGNREGMIVRNQRCYEDNEEELVRPMEMEEMEGE